MASPEMYNRCYQQSVESPQPQVQDSAECQELSMMLHKESTNKSTVRPPPSLNEGT